MHNKSSGLFLQTKDLTKLLPALFFQETELLLQTLHHKIKELFVAEYFRLIAVQIWNYIKNTKQLESLDTFIYDNLIQDISEKVLNSIGSFLLSLGEKLDKNEIFFELKQKKITSLIELSIKTILHKAGKLTSSQEYYEYNNDSYSLIRASLKIEDLDIALGYVSNIPLSEIYLLPEIEKNFRKVDLHRSIVVKNKNKLELALAKFTMTELLNFNKLSLPELHTALLSLIDLAVYDKTLVGTLEKSFFQSLKNFSDIKEESKEGKSDLLQTIRTIGDYIIATDIMRSELKVLCLNIIFLQQERPSSLHQVLSKKILDRGLI